MKQIHELDSAKTFGVRKVPTLEKLTVQVPAKAIKLIKACYKKYTDKMEGNKHASSWNKILRKAGHKFTQKTDPRETARLQNLKTAFRQAKKFLNDAADFFEGCTGADIIKKYSDQVNKDFEELKAKGYITDADLIQGSEEFPKKEFHIIKPSDDSVHVAGPTRLDTVGLTQSPYYHQVTGAYVFAYDTFKALLKTKFSVQGSEEYILDYLIKPQKQFSSGMSQRLDDSVKNLRTAAKDFKKAKKLVEALKNNKDFIKLLNKEYKENFQTLLTECNNAEAQLNTCVEGAVHRYFLAIKPTSKKNPSSAVTNTVLNISSAVQSVANNMILYHKAAGEGKPLEDIFSSIYTGLNVLNKTINDITQKNKTLINQITQSSPHAKGFIKTFDIYTKNLEEIYSKTSACTKRLNELVDAMRQRKDRKADIKRAWIFFLVGSALGLVQSLLNPMTTFLTTTTKKAPVAALD